MTGIFSLNGHDSFVQSYVCVCLQKYDQEFLILENYGRRKTTPKCNTQRMSPVSRSRQFDVADDAWNVNAPSRTMKSIYQTSTHLLLVLTLTRHPLV